MLPRFAYILELNNPGSVIEYKVDTDVISIDGTSLKNKYGGTLLSASTLDANDQIFPLAFCVVDSENDSSWTWNLKLKYKRIVDIVFHSCGKAFNIVNFEHEMHLLESSAPGIREELKSIGFAKWSRAYSPRRRYNVMTTNISESLNSVMPKAMELPICSMLEALRMMLQRWFFERRNDVDYQVTDFTKTIEGILREQIELS
ncbi:protein FAR1-RELATED SEQUENCE 3-like [Cucumis melo var. makuwa]|uniref:Protein FAR1-RELATED SEQUENCE 3-like n=1 Tax=Cucumis melo var. makuwa TaxID=1194695 RepID=A0A5A7VBR6_CUCMM|nr:protein FAR1-RELATED SEQUENCE 3-like [Cucumis melo var. makuwa]